MKMSAVKKQAEVVRMAGDRLRAARARKASKELIARLRADLREQRRELYRVTSMDPEYALEPVDKFTLPRK